MRVLPFPRCGACGALLVRFPPDGHSIPIPPSLRAALAAEMDAAVVLFERVASLALPLVVSPRWRARARARAHVLRLPGKLDRRRYSRAGKASPDVDALRFSCRCGDRGRLVFVRASAYQREASPDVLREARRDARDLPRVLLRLRELGAERDAADVARAAACFWGAPPAEEAVDLREGAAP